MTDKKQSKVQKLAKGEVLMINIGSTCTGGRVEAVTQDQAQITLTSPACTDIGEKIALSRRIEKHWRFVFLFLFLVFLFFNFLILILIIY